MVVFLSIFILNYILNIILGYYIMYITWKLRILKKVNYFIVLLAPMINF